MRVYNFGSINIDYVYRVSRFVSPGETLASNSLETVLGGKGANQSVALARAGAQVSHIGRVAQSDEWAKTTMTGYGVNTDCIQLIDESSGHAIIQVDDHGENAIVLHGGANRSFDSESLAALLKDARPGDWLLLQNECNALAEAFDIAKEKQLHIAFNPAPMSDAASQLPLDQCRVLILNEVEAAQLAGELSTEKSDANVALISALQNRYPNVTIVLTLGSKGATLIHGNDISHADAPVVETVDTTGAGDTFVGYFLAGLIDGMSEAKALERACIAGSLAVTVAGATPGIPQALDVDRLLKGS